MLLPDVNVLLAAFRADHVHHAPARAFLESARAGEEVIGLSDVALAGVVRLSTNPRVFVHPDAVASVIGFLDVMLEPPAQLVRAGAAHWARFAGVVRLATNPRVFLRPDAAASVLGFLDVMLEPPAQLVRAGAAHWARFAELCRELQLRGNLVPDAYLAALALEQSARLVTFDRGFGRYPGLRWRCLLDG